MLDLNQIKLRAKEHKQLSRTYTVRDPNRQIQLEIRTDRYSERSEQTDTVRDPNRQIQREIRTDR